MWPWWAVVPGSLEDPVGHLPFDHTQVGLGLLGIRPTAGSGWAELGRPDRLPATYHRTHGVRYFHGRYSVGDDRLWGINHRKKARDNLCAHKGADIRRWAKKNSPAVASPGPACSRSPTSRTAKPFRTVKVGSPTDLLCGWGSAKRRGAGSSPDYGLAVPVEFAEGQVTAQAASII